MVAKIRMSAHKLNRETGRYGSKANSAHNKVCEFCSDPKEIELLLVLPFAAEPILEDAIHVLRTCPKYHSSRLRIKEPVKSLLFSDVASIFKKEFILETTKYIRRVFNTRFKRKDLQKGSKLPSALKTTQT